MSKNYTLFWILIIVLIGLGCSTQFSKNLEYIDQVRPSITPLLFAESFISKDSISEYGSIFNKNNNEFYFAVDSAGRSFIKYTYQSNGEWTEPITIISDTTHSYNDPFLSNDEKRLYYISDQPRNEQDSIKDYDIWYSEKRGSKWSMPINAGMNINSDAQEYYISFSNDGTIYFASNTGTNEKRKHDFDIYQSVYNGSEFAAPEKLDSSINTKNYEADVFIAPDESYIIFCAARKTGFGRGDLYISFKNPTGEWTTSNNMGESINTNGHELCPFVTKDGKFLFYTSQQDIYWVSTEIIDSLRESHLELRLKSRN